jgi:sulfite exporter TauE/SafE
MPIQIIITGFMLGMVSSFHCIGMCGPLALSLPVQHLSHTKRTAMLLTYHSGRIFIYSLLGLLFGLAGRRIYMAGLQQWLSIILGGLMLFSLIHYFIYRNALQPAFLRRAYGSIQQYFMKYWKSPSFLSFLMLGIANGLLPCGMVYLAIAGALSLSNVSYSVVFMAVFGAGTIPMLIALSFLGFFVNVSMRNSIKRLTPIMIGLMAVLLILRGLNLGIPFISPVMAGAPGHAVECH